MPEQIQTVDSLVSVLNIHVTLEVDVGFSRLAVFYTGEASVVLDIRDLGIECLQNLRVLFFVFQISFEHFLLSNEDSV